MTITQAALPAKQGRLLQGFAYIALISFRFSRKGGEKSPKVPRSPSCGHIAVQLGIEEPKPDYVSLLQ